jgi:multidrug efflux pump subunit AcrB
MVSWRTAGATAAVVAIAYFATAASMINQDEEWLVKAVLWLTLTLIALGAVLLVRVRLRSVGVGILIGTAAGFLSIVVLGVIALNEIGKSTY